MHTVFLVKRSYRVKHVFLRSQAIYTLTSLAQLFSLNLTKFSTITCGSTVIFKYSHYMYYFANTFVYKHPYYT